MLPLVGNGRWTKRTSTRPTNRQNRNKAWEKRRLAATSIYWHILYIGIRRAVIHGDASTLESRSWHAQSRFHENFSKMRSEHLRNKGAYLCPDEGTMLFKYTKDMDALVVLLEWAWPYLSKFMLPKKVSEDISSKHWASSVNGAWPVLRPHACLIKERYQASNHRHQQRTSSGNTFYCSFIIECKAHRSSSSLAIAWVRNHHAVLCKRLVCAIPIPINASIGGMVFAVDIRIFSFFEVANLIIRNCYIFDTCITIDNALILTWIDKSPDVNSIWSSSAAFCPVKHIH